ncbi:L,D-transpeptidase [Egbenema bharatensis]|uniref:L,D-transpeptidase n=1 Tax=Egbenema bharatensis TaxID=3463334 RepID=UPI003A86A617
MRKRFLNMAGLSLVIGLAAFIPSQVRSGQVGNLAHLQPALVNIVEVETPDVSPSESVTASDISTNPSVYPDAPSGVEVVHSTLAANPPAAQSQFAEVHLEISLSNREVRLFQGDTRIKSYPIGIGRAGWETPVGSFQVRQMRENPTWISPFTGERIPGGDPRNPMGRHWIGFWTDGHLWVGFHGTPNAATVGNAASHGCIHMHAQDLEELYSQVQLGTLVTVTQ